MNRFVIQLTKLAIAVALYLSMSGLQAQTSTWDGGDGTSPDWGTGSNWVGDAAPANNDSLIFTGSNNLSTNNNSPPGRVYTNITFDDSGGAAGNFTLAGDTISLTGNIFSNTVASTDQTISAGVSLEGGGTQNFDAAINNSFEISGIISGAATTVLQLNDGDNGYSGTITLTGENTYAGGTLVSRGTVVAGNDLAFGTGTVTLQQRPTSGGAIPTLRIADGVDLGNTVVVSGTGSSKEINVASGDSGEISGNLDLRENGTGSARVSVGSGGVLTVSGSVVSSSGVAKGPFTKLGEGTLDLTGINTFDGAVTVSEGTLLINGNSSAANGAVTVESGATLGGSGTIGGVTTIEGRHSVGNSPGIQTFTDDLIYSGGASSVLWELIDNTTADRGTNYDGIDVEGNLDFIGATTLDLDFNLAGSDVDWEDSFWDRYSWNSWLLYDVAGDIYNFQNLSINVINWSDGQDPAHSFDTSANFPAGGNFFLTNTGSQIFLNYNGVPEPTTFGLLGLIMGGLTIFTRRRRSVQS